VRIIEETLEQDHRIPLVQTLTIATGITGCYNKGRMGKLADLARRDRKLSDVDLCHNLSHISDSYIYKKVPNEKQATQQP
jgi:hypothetical protein